MSNEVFLSYNPATKFVAYAIQHQLARDGISVLDASRHWFGDADWPTELRWAIETSRGCLIVAGARALEEDPMLQRQIGVALGLQRPVTWLMPVADGKRADLIAPEAVHRAYYDEPTTSGGPLALEFDDDDPVLSALAQGSHQIYPTERGAEIAGTTDWPAMLSA